MIKLGAREPGLIVSASGHAALFVAGLVAFWSPATFPAVEEGVPVDVISEREFNEITRGEKTAKQALPNPRPRVDRVSEIKQDNDPGEAKKDIAAEAKTPPPPPRPEPVAEPEPPKPAPKPFEAPQRVAIASPPPRPPEPAKPEPVKPPPAPPKPAEKAEVEPDAEPIKQAVPTPPKPPKEPPKSEPPKPEAQKPKEPPKAEPPKPDAKALASLIDTADAEARAKAEEARKAAEKKAAEDKKKAEAKARAEAKAKEQAEAKKLEDQIRQKLLVSREAPSSTGATGAEVNRTAALGTREATGQRLSPSDTAQLAALLIDQIRACWTVIGAPPPVTPLVRITLMPDGSLQGQPVLANPSADPQFRTFAESGIRAIRQCAPYRIPARFTPMYQEWKSVTVKLNPSDF